MADATQSTNTGDNSFISKIKAGFGTGIEKIGTDVLPNWAAKQVAGESKDQLAQPTFDRTGKNAPARLDNLLGFANGGGSNTKLLVGGALALVLIGGLVFALRK